MAQIGISKTTGILDKYRNKSKYSTQDGNQSFAGNITVGGFTQTGEYTLKYAGGNGQPGAGQSISHGNYDFFKHADEQPEPPQFND